jgi:hypothetical protein
MVIVTSPLEEWVPLVSSKKRGNIYDFSKYIKTRPKLLVRYWQNRFPFISQLSHFSYELPKSSPSPPLSMDEPKRERKVSI